MRGVLPFLKDAWYLARPYFSAASEERWSARGLLALIVALRLMMVGINVIYSFWNNLWFTSLQQRDWNTFIHLLLFGKKLPSGWYMPGFSLFAAIFIVVAITRVYMSQLLQIRWRRWMTHRFIDHWMSDRAYYRLSLTASANAKAPDNPDQRIADDLRDFIGDSISGSQGILYLGVDFLSNIVSLFSFITILWGLSGHFTVFGWSIPGYMVWIALIYAILGTWLTHLVGRQLVPLNFEKQRVEANFRFALVRVRENTEGIALYGGEAGEKQTLLQRFAALMLNWRQLMTRYKYLIGLTATYGQLASVFPFVIASPRYFAGKVQLGALTQTANAFGEVQGAMSWFVDQYSTIAYWRATVERLATFRRAIEAARAHAFEGVHTEAEGGDGFALHKATIALPDGHKLLDRADLTLAPGEPVLVTGQSGSGKSTLFRAFAGIWPFGSGGVRRPQGRTLFLPQQPYLPLGTLRHAVAYPSDVGAFSDAEMHEALREVGLAHLISHLDKEDNWSMTLSGGERQRLALARALLIKPDWLFLDEAMASLDPETEARMRDALHRLLPNTTIVSIEHRPAAAGLRGRHIVLEREPAGVGRLVEAARQAAE